jgi:hypothetical protein
MIDVPPRQSQFDASSRHHSWVSNAGDSCQLSTGISTRKGLSSSKHPRHGKELPEQLSSDISMQQQRSASIMHYGSPGAFSQECVVTALLQQNDALQQQLQDLLAANQQQAAAAAAAAPAADGSTAVQQLTPNERRLVKVLKRMQKDKERCGCLCYINIPRSLM